MMRYLGPFFLLVVLTAPTSSWAADQYVRQGAGGAGTSWTDAWSDTANISWASLAPGDTVWFAGGTYGVLLVAQDGNADTPAGRIFIKRATVASHGTETGWNAAYDALVNIGQIKWTSANKGNYVTIDGQTANGIRITMAAGADPAITFDRGQDYVTLMNLELAGPCGASPCNQVGDNRGIDLTAFVSGAYEQARYLHIHDNSIHGFCTLLMLFNADNAVIENNDFYDNGTTGTVCHPNFLYTSGSDNVTLRYNKIYNFASEGIIMSSGNGVSGTWDIYGNLFYRTSGGNSGPYDRVIETRVGENGPIHFYNNTVVGLWQTWNGAGGTWATGTASTNNIYWNTPGNNAVNPSYDFCSLGTCTGTGTIVNGSNPFVDSTTYDYHLLPTVSATHPVDKGTALGATYEKDHDGVTRPLGAAWDMGAYEYGTPPVLSAVTLRLASFVGSTFAIPIWTDSTAADLAGYHVYRCTASGACSNHIAQITAASAAASYSPMTRWFDSKLYGAGTYYYTVAPYNTLGTVGTVSSEVSITVTGKQ